MRTVARSAPLQRRSPAAAVIDGQQLDPEVQLLLRLLDRGVEPSDRTSRCGGARRAGTRTRCVFRGRAVRRRAASRTLTLPGPGGPDRRAALRAGGRRRAGRRCSSTCTAAAGSCATSTRTTTLCRFLAREAGVLVLSVDYRLAPEHPFPGRGRRRARRVPVTSPKTPDELGADPDAVAVGGDSAGGNLAAVVSQLSGRRRAARSPAFCLMLLSGHRPLGEARVVPSSSATASC